MTKRDRLIAFACLRARAIARHQRHGTPMVFDGDRNLAELLAELPPDELRLLADFVHPRGDDAAAQVHELLRNSAHRR